MKFLTEYKQDILLNGYIVCIMILSTDERNSSVRNIYSVGCRKHPCLICRLVRHQEYHPQFEELSKLLRRVVIQKINLGKQLSVEHFFRIILTEEFPTVYGEETHGRTENNIIPKHRYSFR